MADRCDGFPCHIDFMVAHVQRLPTDVAKFGYPYNTHDWIYALPFGTSEGEWQHTCVSTTIYELAADETGEMSARVRRLASLMDGFMACPPHGLVMSRPVVTLSV